MGLVENKKEDEKEEEKKNITQKGFFFHFHISLSHKLRKLCNKKKLKKSNFKKKNLVIKKIHFNHFESFLKEFDTSQNYISLKFSTKDHQKFEFKINCLREIVCLDKYGPQSFPKLDKSLEEKISIGTDPKNQIILPNNDMKIDYFHCYLVAKNCIIFIF